MYALGQRTVTEGSQKTRLFKRRYTFPYSTKVNHFISVCVAAQHFSSAKTLSAEGREKSLTPEGSKNPNMSPNPSTLSKNKKNVLA